MPITKYGQYLLKKAEMDEKALLYAKELLMGLQENILKHNRQEEFPIGTMPEAKANEMYMQMGSDYRHSGDATWALTFDDLKHESSRHMDLKRHKNKTKTTINDYINDLRRIGVAADAGNLASAVSYGRKRNKVVNGVSYNFKNPAIWSEDPKHIVDSQTPFAFLNTAENGVFNIRTQYPHNINKARDVSKQNPARDVVYLPELVYRKLKADKDK